MKAIILAMLILSIVIMPGCKKDGSDLIPTPLWRATDTVLVTWIIPACVMGGDPFIIRGLNFDGTSRVFINGVEATITSRSG